MSEGAVIAATAPAKASTKIFFAFIHPLGIKRLIPDVSSIGKHNLSDLRSQLIAVLPRLHRLAGVIVRNGQDGDDLFQKTVARMLEREAGWEPGSRLDLWAARIMKNIWLDELRMRSRWARLVEPMPETDLLSDEGAAVGELERTAESRRVRNLVEALPEEQRLAVKLVVLNELSYAEAAEILEIPEGTLTSRLARGRAALSQLIAEGRS